jgi:hypothetical protein
MFCKQGEEAMPIDTRRFWPIEVEQINNATFHLTIGGTTWSEIEWSPSRRSWCIQDSEGKCLSHCESIVGQDIDQSTAIAEAKAMIRDGRMPSPEEAAAARAARKSAEEVVDSSVEDLGEPLGEPMEILKDPALVPVSKK